MKKGLCWIGVLLLGAMQVVAVNNCLTFDGVNDWVNTPPAAGIPTTGNFTVECWAKCSVNPEAHKEILSQGGSGNAFYIGTDPGGNIRLGDGWISTGIPFPFGGWHHFAVVVEEGNTRFYIDGEPKVAKGGRIPNPASESPFRIATQYGGFGEYWSGSIDDIRIWTGVRTADEIRNNRVQLSGNAGVSSTLRVHYLFDQVTGLVLSDSQNIGEGNLKNMTGREWDSVVAVDLTTENTTVDYSIDSFTVRGTNDENALTLSWENTLNGSFGSQPASSATFEVADIPLDLGLNQVVVTVANAAGMLDADTVQVTRLGEPALLLNIPVHTVVGSSITSVDLSGTNNLWVTGELSWTNALGGASGTIPVSGTDFHLSAIPLSLGSNVITVTGTNALGAAAFDSVRVERIPDPVIQFSTTDTEVEGLNETFTINGTHNAATVGRLRWTNAANSAQGSVAVAGLAFEIVDIPLVIGENPITVSGTNALGIATSDLVMITRDSVHAGSSAGHYVSLMGSGVWPYTNWVTAATNIQLAIDTAMAGDTVWVGDGTFEIEKEIVLSKSITLRSLNGPELTKVSGAGNCRGLYCDTNAVVMGIHVKRCSDDDYGGGVYLDGAGMLTNCWISDCSSEYGGGAYLYEGGALSDCKLWGNYADYGGGAYLEYGGTLTNCALLKNYANYNGGGACSFAGGTLVNCVILENEIWSGTGGGVDVSGEPMGDEASALYNCTIVGNSVKEGQGGGLFSGATGIVHNCIIWDNTLSNRMGNCDGTLVGFTNCCTLPLLGANGMTNNPMLAHSPFEVRLRAGSPCIDAGLTETWMLNTTDLDGGARVVNTTIDIGAYEYSASQPYIGFTNVTSEVCSSSNTLHISLNGGNNAAVVGTLSWTNFANDAFGTLPVAMSWTISDISLEPGNNLIMVTGTNVNGLATQDRATIFYSSVHAGDSLLHYASPFGRSEWPYDSWATATTNLQDAIDAAMENDDVWISSGVYMAPMNGFSLRRGVDLYGGFSSQETSLADRDWEVNTTVLSGDVDRDDLVNAYGVTEFTTGLVGNNSRHVLTGFGWWKWGDGPGDETYMPGIICSNRIDGLIITGANGDVGFGVPHDGGGIAIETNEWLLIKNCRIQGNLAPSGVPGASGYYYGEKTGGVGGQGKHGGGLYVNGGQVEIENTLISGNRAGSGGAGGEGASFFDGYAGGAGAFGGFGGGVYASSAQVQLRDCMINYNTAGLGGAGGNGGRGALGSGGDAGAGGSGGQGGGLYGVGGPFTVQRSMISGNQAGPGAVGGNGGSGGDYYLSNGGFGGPGGNGAGVAFLNANVTLENTLLDHNIAGAGGDGGAAFGTDGIPGDEGFGGDGEMGGKGGALYAVGGTLQLLNSTVHNNESGMGGRGGVGGIFPGIDGPRGLAGGLYCNVAGETLVANSIVYRNSAETAADLYQAVLSGPLLATHSILSLATCGGDPVRRVNVYDVDPLLDLNYRPLNGSVCIDGGTNELAASGRDLYGTPRPLDGDNDGVNTVDIGCTECIHATADSDGDQFSDADEFVADTDSTDSNSWFHILNCDLASDIPSVQLMTSANRVYTLQSCTNLTEGSWTDVPAPPRIWGSGSIDTFTDASPETSVARFYRMKVEQSLDVP